MNNAYFYNTAGGNATLNKGDNHPIVKIGKFKTEKEALEACKKHYNKVKTFLERMNKPVPDVFFL